MSPIESFSKIIPAASPRPLYLSALIWLLLHEVVEKQRTFIRVVIGEETKTSARRNWGKEGLTGDSQEGDGSSIGNSVDDSTTSSRKRTSSARADHDETMNMAIISTSPLSPPLPRSQQSAMMMKLPRNRRNSTLAPGNNSGRSRTLSTFSSNSERIEDDIKAPTIILEPGRPSMIESRWLTEICRGKDQAVVAKFDK